MGLARDLVRKATKNLWVKFMAGTGGKWIAKVVDTSADAPDSRFKPKRNLYEQMLAEEQEGAEDGHDHDHAH